MSTSPDKKKSLDESDADLMKRLFPNKVIKKAKQVATDKLHKKPRK